ncbi:MAG: dihydrolipoyl dehydrogenase, partial [Planctomycetota bacterium]
ESLEHAADFGFEVGEVKVNWPRVIERSRDSANKLASGVEFLMKKNKIPVYSGTGSMLSMHRIRVQAADGTTTEIQSTNTILATGARPAVLPGIELDGERVITSREAMIAPQRPESLTVIGAGAIGLEFAYFYSVFGTKVTLLEYAPNILPSGDAEVCDALARSFRKRKIQIESSAKVTGVRRDGDSTITTYEKNGETKEVRSDLALVAVGVRGNSEGLGLENIGVKVERGFVPVDEFGQTNVAGVYAIGDLTGPPALAHAASAEALQAVRHIAGERPDGIDATHIPACIYCKPQVASVGLTEAQAAETGRELKIGRFPFVANGKAVAVGDVEGFVKIIGDAESGELLGAHIVGPDATEMIAELGLALKSEISVEELHHTIHAHPTLSESVMEAAADWADEVIGI